MLGKNGSAASRTVSRPRSCVFKKLDKIFFHRRKRRFLLGCSHLDQTRGLRKKFRLVFAEDLPDPPLPKVPSGRPRIRFSGHHDSKHGLCSRRFSPARFAFADPQIKKFSPRELPFLDEVFEGCLPANALSGAEPFWGFHLLAPLRFNFYGGAFSRCAP